MLPDLAIYLATGAIAGFLAGLLGIGGGLIIVTALVWILPRQGFAPGHVMHVALATALASIVLTSVSSTLSHARRGAVMWGTAFRLAPGLVAGGIVGALVASRLGSDVLRWAVALFCLFAAWRMARTVTPGATDAREPASPWLAAWGLLIGAVSAIVGIGGGSLTVPLLVAAGARPVRAVATSAAAGFAIALASAVSYAFGGAGAAAALPDGSVGFVYLPAAGGIAIASVLLAPLGARAAHALGSNRLRRVFAVFLLAMAVAVATAG